jgi:hypothetical protein
VILKNERPVLSSTLSVKNEYCLDVAPAKAGRGVEPPDLSAVLLALIHTIYSHGEDVVMQTLALIAEVQYRGISSTESICKVHSRTKRKSAQAIALGEI